MDIEYRPATEDDLEILLAWRSHPNLYENFYIQDGPLRWEEHVEWWFDRENRRDWIITVNTDDRWRDVGNLNISDLDTESPEIGIFVGETTLWGNGVATAAVEHAVDWLRERGYTHARSRILDDNEGSKRTFRKVGFERVGNAREQESEYELRL